MKRITPSDVLNLDTIQYKHPYVESYSPIVYWEINSQERVRNLKYSIQDSQQVTHLLLDVMKAVLALNDGYNGTDEMPITNNDILNRVFSKYTLGVVIVAKRLLGRNVYNEDYMLSTSIINDLLIEEQQVREHAINNNLNYVILV